jgi:hypothetical protein
MPQTSRKKKGPLQLFPVNKKYSFSSSLELSFDIHIDGVLWEIHQVDIC